MAIWEYLVEMPFRLDRRMPPLDQLGVYLTRYGEQGWELVVALNSEDGLVLIFKRPMQAKRVPRS